MKHGRTQRWCTSVSAQIFWRWMAPPNWLDGAFATGPTPARPHGQTSWPALPGTVPGSPYGHVPPSGEEFARFVAAGLVY